MKNKIKKITVILFSACLVFLSACTKEKAEKPNVAVIVKATDSDFWHSVKNGAEAAATEYNVSFTFEGPESEEDYETQNKLIKTAVERGADAIVFSAIDCKKSTSALTEAVQAGVKIITIDSAADFSKASLFIGTDNLEAGAEAAKEAVKAFSPGEKIFIGLVNYYKETDNGIKREEGFRKYIESIADAEISASANTASNTASASACAVSLLKEHPEINVLVGFNEWTTLGVGDAIEKLGLEGKVCGIGFDSNTVSIGMLEKGIMNGLIVQNPFAIGYLGIEKAAELISGGETEGNNIYTSVFPVNKNNIFEKETQKLLFSFN